MVRVLTTIEQKKKTSVLRISEWRVFVEPSRRGKFYPVEGFLPEEVTFSVKMKR